MYHAHVLRSAIKHKKNVVTTSYVTPIMMELDEAYAAAACQRGGIQCAANRGPLAT